MEPEIVLVVLATFVGGGAMGATGMLLTQWVVRKMSPPPQPRAALMDPRDLESMKTDVADIAVRLHSVDARLDFTEQLLGGALSVAHPPESLPPAPAPSVQADLEADGVATPREDEEAPASLDQDASPDQEQSLDQQASGEAAAEATEAIPDPSEREDAFGA